MSEKDLHILIGTALTDAKFRAQLLHGDRCAALAEFDFTVEERRIILDIEAKSIQEFAAQLYALLGQHASRYVKPD